MKKPLMPLTVLLVIFFVGARRSDPVDVRFTEVPQKGQGSASEGNIAGVVSNLEHPQRFKVVVYARTNRWYVQPLTDAPFTDISPDGTWSTWTHLGSRYAALVVKPSFTPAAAAQELPSVGGDVLARTEAPAR